MKLNENGFPSYLEVRELIEYGNKETLLYYINVMYEKYNDLAKATKWMQPEYIEYLKKLDEQFVRNDLDSKKETIKRIERLIWKIYLKQLPISLQNIGF